jgi:ferrous-iron efflux pump FieF
MTKIKSQLMKQATYAAVLVSFVLILIKSIGLYLTESVALMASLADSIIDFLISLINLFAVRHSLEPADHEHRFGHGKAEALAGLGQAIFIFFTSIFIFSQAVKRLIVPHEITEEFIGILFILVCIIFTVGLVLFQKKAIKKTGSIAISADNLHYFQDLLSNFGVIVALFLSFQFNFGLADPIIAIFISFYICYGAWKIFIKSYDMLMDRELPESKREAIKRIIMQHQSVRGLHDLKTRASGTNIFIQAHIELDPKISLIEAHNISDEVENLLLSQFTNAEIIIHQDPHGLYEKKDFTN